MLKSEDLTLKVIAHIRTDFPTKFGIPRQSGLVEELTGKIVFTPKYRNPDALRGLSGYTHLWLLWVFSEVKKEGWSPTVRPPRLGGNTRMGVFATRSPFRPNPVGLSCVKILDIQMNTPDGPVIFVSGADLMDETPIFDIKPYLPWADARQDAIAGFASEVKARHLCVEIPREFEEILPREKLEALRGALSQDPRPSYHDDPQRVYGFAFSDYEVKFCVDGEMLQVKEIRERKKEKKV